MDIIDERKTVVQSIAGFIPQELAILRLDLIHPGISGNKWYKLKYNLKQAKDDGCDTVLSFGGAYSNHLVALAVAAKEAGLKSIGIVRGEHEEATLSPSLVSCREYGMRLQFISREEYKKNDDADWLEALITQYPDAFIIPEGGANEWGREGAGEIAGLIPDSCTHVCVSVGSGTTLAGIRRALPEHVHIIGFVPMKNGAYLKEEIQEHLSSVHADNWKLVDEFHFGGFGKCNDELIAFMNDFYKAHTIPLDIVYTSKMMFGVRELSVRGFFPADARILCIHTGGLQGNVSVADRLVY